MDSQKYNKLPKWARLEMEHQLREIGELRRRLATYESDERNGAIFAVTQWKPGTKIGVNLPDSASVEFKLGAAWTDTITVSLSIDKRFIYINGGGELSITPRASNVIQIFPEAHR